MRASIKTQPLLDASRPPWPTPPITMCAFAQWSPNRFQKGPRLSCTLGSQLHATSHTPYRKSLYLARQTDRDRQTLAHKPASLLVTFSMPSPSQGSVKKGKAPSRGQFSEARENSDGVSLWSGAHCCNVLTLSAAISFLFWLGRRWECSIK